MVITFLPFESFTQSLSILDDKRLGKQRVEASQILKSLTSNTKGWYNHPATKMWKGFENALRVYFNASLDEWEKRGFSNNMDRMAIDGVIIQPWWLGWEPFHMSHQASLCRKHPAYYNPLFPNLEQFYMEHGYIWPSHHE